VKQALLILKTLSPTAEIEVAEMVRSAVTGLGWNSNWAESKIPLADWIGLNTLVEIASVGFETVQELLESLGSQLLAAAEPKTAAITVSTIHQAKGLEWETVFLPRFVDPKDASDEVIAEHARIQFVALTRSRKNLQISFSRATGNRSRFLDSNLPSNPIAVVAQAEKVVQFDSPKLRAELCEICGVGISAPLEVLTRWCEKCQPPANSEIKRQLEELRTALAAELGKPDWLILSDNSVLAVSIRIPQSLEELKQIQSFARLPDSTAARIKQIFKLPA
jgi:DNA helicase-2/ATP-dependent DNA helicase PcrA